MTWRVERLVASVVLLWVAAWLVVEMIAAWPFDTDDAYITLRYARHLAAGHGIVWNPGGTTVEGYSNFTHVLLGAAALRVGLDPLLVLEVVNAASLLGTVAVVYALARTFAGPLLATLPVVILSVFPGEALWAVSGLETALYQLLVAGATLALARGMGFGSVLDRGGAPRPPVLQLAHLAVSSGLLVLASLTRPEGPVVAVVLGLALLCRVVEGVRAGWFSGQRATQAGALFALVFAVPYAVYFGWRFMKFGHLVPNTVLCKAAWAGDPWELLRAFWAQAWWVVLAAMAVAPRSLDARHVALWGVPLAYALILYGADPIVGHDARHFLAALVLLSVAAGANAAGWLSLVSGAKQRVEAAVVLVVVVFAAPSYGDTAADLSQRAARYARRMEARKSLAEYLAATLPPDATYLIGDTGLVPYETPQRVIDAFCLNSAEATEPETRGSTSRWVTRALSEAPDVIVVHSSHPETLIPRPEYGFYPELLRREEVETSYRLDRVFGDARDDFHYWVLRRVARPVGAARRE